jgi:hypothetical protein
MYERREQLQETGNKSRAGVGVHTEARGETASVRSTRYPRPCGHDGGGFGSRPHLRGPIYNRNTPESSFPKGRQLALTPSFDILELG